MSARLIDRLVRRMARREHSRRGLVIVMALAVLAVLAIAAVSYVAIVRIDRDSSMASSKDANYQQQVNAVVSEMQALLSADMFGNKVVTSSVPSTYWPRMFENGGTTDYPRVSGTWATNSDPTLAANQLLADLAQPANKRMAEPDDAWLASTEAEIKNPLTGALYPSTSAYWRQITNLRSAYKYVRNGNTGFWQRGDGRFVDLLQWFLQPDPSDTPLHGNGGVDLLSQALADGPAFGVSDYLNAAGNRITTNNTAVYGSQMPQVVDGPGRTVQKNHDERRWVDTDGDGRPDARWQQLDSLGNLFGLNWVVAARIIDASSLVNFNTAMQFPVAKQLGAFGTNVTPNRKVEDVVGTGETPADIDFMRLVANASPNDGPFLPTDLSGGTFAASVRTNLLLGGNEPAFRDALNKGLGFQPTIADLGVAVPGGAYDARVDKNVFYSYDPARKQAGEQEFGSGVWGFNDWATRHQRAVMYAKFGCDPDKAVSDASIGYPERDLVDLQAFWCTNNSSVTSRIETLIDGPESTGYLGTGPALMGPLRSREGVAGAVAASPRDFSTGEPSLDRIDADIRHLLTPINGVGGFSPVPVANYATGTNAPKPQQPHYWDGQYFNTKVSLPSLKAKADALTLTSEDGQKVFDSFVWALAPLAGDRPLFSSWTAAITSMLPTNSINYYGGGVNGPAAYIASKNSNIDMASTYAVMRAAALTANLIDAQDGAYAGSSSDASQMVHLYKTAVNSALPAPLAGSHELVLSTRLPQGNINGTLDPASNYIPTGGITFMGLDRQPFVIEASSFALYQAQTEARTTTIKVWDGPGIAHTDDQIGAVIGVELYNPWPTSVDYTKYQIVIRNPAGSGITLDLALTDDPAPAIAPGDRKVLYYSKGPIAGNPEFDTAWTEALNQWKSKLGNPAKGFSLKNGASAGADALTIAPAVGTVPPVFFQMLINQGDTTPVNLPVLLVRKAVANVCPDMVVDRLSPPDQAPGGTPFPWMLDQDYTFTADAAVPVQYTKVGLRIGLDSAQYRPNQRSGAANGFTPAVIERRSTNTVAKSDLAPAADPEASVPQPSVDRGRQLWFRGTTDSTNFPDVGPYTAADIVDNVVGVSKLGSDKGAPGYTVPPFQLFVPNRALFSPSEVLQLSTLATMYFNTSASTAPVVDDAANLALSYDATDHVTLRYGAGAWHTMSEQLGSDTELQRDPLVPGTPNLYVGVLDPSRYVLNNTNLPDTMNIPLALRVVDCFEALPLLDFLAQGRVNVNTAPRSVLELLPFVSPLAVVQSQNGQDCIPREPSAGGNASPLLAWMLDYRDPTFAGDRATLTGMTGLRKYQGGVDTARGFATAAELAITGSWSNAAQGIVSGAGITSFPGGGFMSLGADTRNNAGMPLGRDYIEYGSDDNNGAIPPLLKPTDDPEEKLAIFRSLANIVSTRSDVYLAWFVLRGYDPEVIESIKVASANNVNDANAAMDSADFRPAYESRWLVLLDRSNVKKPTDRPRILMKVELPSAKP